MTPPRSDAAARAAAAGLDAIAVKPSEVPPGAAAAVDVDLVTVDYEGRDTLPAPAVIRDLQAAIDVRVTVPVRADGFDPLGDDAAYASIPDDAGLVLVAGHPDYLAPRERDRAVAPRLAAALERAPDAWVGTEGIERIALATGATQFELLAPGSAAAIRGLRAADPELDVAVYAPVALTEDEDDVLDALGAYVARRPAVRRRLPGDAAVDAAAADEARTVLLDAIDGYAITGDAGTVRERVASLREAGADSIVGYPARGAADLTVLEDS